MLTTHTAHTIALRKRAHNVDPPSHQYSTAHKRIRRCTCVVYIFYLVHILATQSAIYRLKITTSVEPNWQRAKRFTHTNICANACTHTHLQRNTRTHFYRHHTMRDRQPRCQKTTHVMTIVLCKRTWQEIQPKNRNDCLQFFVRVWARHCGSHINRCLYAASHCIVRTAQIYIYL